MRSSLQGTKIVIIVKMLESNKQRDNPDNDKEGEDIEKDKE